MTDRGEPDDKILAVPSNDPFYEEYFDIADIPQHYLREVEHFFHIYKDLEGKRVQTIGWEQAPLRDADHSRVAWSATMSDTWFEADPERRRVRTRRR